MKKQREDKNICLDVNNPEPKFSYILFFRQLFIAISLWSSYFLNGVVIGTPTVVIPQLRRELNSTTKFNEDYVPWLSSVFGIGGTPWVFILPVLLDVIGRKYTFAVICLVTLIGFIVFYCSSSTLCILISELIVGILITASQSVFPVIVTEYTAPRYRGLFLTVKSASFLWGIWIANAIGTFWHWKNIGILAFVCCTYMITISIWPESPYWLATKGKFEECTTSHRWLRGVDSVSEDELAKLIESQEHELNKYSADKNKNRLSKCVKMVKLPEFYKPVLISMLLLIQYYVSGKLVCTMFAIDIIKKITADENSAYKIMLILDGVSVFSSYVSSITSAFVKRRSLMITTTFVAVMFLYFTSLYLYLVKLSLLSENHTITIALLTIYSMAISCGTIILVSSIIGEVLPLRYKSWSIFILALFINILHFSTLRIAPEILRSFDVQGAFLFYGMGSTLTLFLLYKYLPETKGKTLQEIEDYFKTSTKASEESKLLEKRI